MKKGPGLLRQPRPHALRGSYHILVPVLNLQECLAAMSSAGSRTSWRMRTACFKALCNTVWAFSGRTGEEAERTPNIEGGRRTAAMQSESLAKRTHLR